MITHHTTLIQALIDKYGLKKYCEVGVQSTAQNFDKIKCEYKIGIEPEPLSSMFIFTGTSDEFFATNKDTFDIFFLDGLHHKEQIKKDFDNALACLSDNGFIVIHDVLPENEAGTIVPRETKVWWGDVYKWAMQLHCCYSGINFKTFNIDNGCMLIWKDETKRMQPPQFIVRSESNWWQHYKEVGHVLMSVTSDVVI